MANIIREEVFKFQEESQFLRERHKEGKGELLIFLREIPQKMGLAKLKKLHQNRIF